LKAKGNVKGLIKALGYQKDEQLRQSAAEALGQIRKARALKPLITALNDTNAKVRRAAAEALGQIGDARAVRPLIATLKGEKMTDWPVSRAAADSIGQIGASAVEPLVKILKNTNDQMRHGAAEMLGEIGDARAVEPLVVALKDEAGRVRHAAAQSLGQIGDARAVEPLIAAVKDDSEHVRKSAAKALGQIGDSQAVEPLTALLDDQYDEAQWEAARALATITGQDHGLPPAGDELDRLAIELVHIGETVGYRSLDEPRSDVFDERGRNLRVRAIGARLNDIGGTGPMREAHQYVIERLSLKAGILLESAWGNIGLWQP